MKQLGKISHISNRGRVILKSNQTPSFGLPVFTDNKKKFGKVYDVFGPTKSPYISIKVFTKNPKDLENRVGDILYVSSKKIDKRGRRKRKKK